MKKVRVWDLPIRLFHWALVLLMIGAVATQSIGGNAMEWHFRCGYAILTLLLFRILWGVFGTKYARFTDFVSMPPTILAYLKGAATGKLKYLGHNPVGSLSVLGLLGVLLAQAISGLFSNDDIASEGPMVKFIAKELSDQITWFHKDINSIVIYALVALHVAAIAYYYFRKRQNLVKPMLTGDKEGDDDAPAADDSWAMRLRALILLAASAGIVYYVVTLKPAPLA